MWAALRRYAAQHHLALIALFIALGGTSYAAATIGSGQVIDNSLKSADVRNDSSSQGGLTGADIRRDALTGADVRALGGADVNDGGLTGADVQDNSLKGGDIDERTLNVSKVIARPRGNSSVTAGDGLNPANYPLSNNTFTQAADESLGAAGEVVFDWPSGCPGFFPGFSPVQVQVSIDGTFMPAFVSVPLGVAPGANGVKGSFSVAALGIPGLPGGNLFEPGTATGRAVQAKVSDSCPSTAHTTVKSVKVAVQGIR